MNFLPGILRFRIKTQVLLEVQGCSRNLMQVFKGLISSEVMYIVRTY